MTLIRSFALAVITASFLFSAAYATSDTPSAIKTGKTVIGVVLTDAQDMTLYHFAKDTPGKSNCAGGCARIWPPLKARSNAKPVGAFTIITRDNGASQWAHKGMPLYTYMNDNKPGDVTGEGVNNVWSVAIP
jgi:predicted lipoprotein with Yx(FWY)xxD motif